MNRSKLFLYISWSNYFIFIMIILKYNIDDLRSCFIIYKWSTITKYGIIIIAYIFINIIKNSNIYIDGQFITWSLDIFMVDAGLC